MRCCVPAEETDKHGGDAWWCVWKYHNVSLVPQIGSRLLMLFHSSQMILYVEVKERCTNNCTMRCEGKTSTGLDDEQTWWWAAAIVAHHSTAEVVLWVIFWSPDTTKSIMRSFLFFQIPPRFTYIIGFISATFFTSSPVTLTCNCGTAVTFPQEKVSME